MQQQRHNVTHPEVVVTRPGVLVVIITNALPAGQQQLLVCYDSKQASVLGAPVAGSQVLQDCHQQGSVEAVPIPCKVTLLFSGLKVLCMSCILQFFWCFQGNKGWFFHVSVSTGTCGADRFCKVWPACDAASLHAVENAFIATGKVFMAAAV